MFTCCLTLITLRHFRHITFSDHSQPRFLVEIYEMPMGYPMWSPPGQHPALASGAS